MDPMRRSFSRPGAGEMTRGTYPTSTTRQAVHLLGGMQRVRTRVRGFAPWSPEKATLALLDQVQGILDEYADHLPLTIRQIFYRLVGASRQHRPRRLTTAPSAAKPCQAEALPPDVLANILRTAIEERVDRRVLDRVLRQERRIRHGLIEHFEA